MNKLWFLTLALGFSLRAFAIDTDIPSEDRVGNGRKNDATAEMADRAGNGGGTGEKNLLFAYLSLPEYVRACESNPACATDSRERDLLRKIAADMKAHPASAKRIRFLSETESPGAFQADGLVHGVPRSARTGDGSESYIWINRNHLYHRTAKGTTEPIDVPTAAALVLDEVAHHVEPAFKDATEHTRLDLLCARLRVLLSSKTQTVTSDSVNLPLTLSVLNLNVPGSSSRVMISNSYESRDLTDKIKAQVSCQRGLRKAGAFNLTNLHWHKSRPRSQVLHYGTLASDYHQNPRQQTLHAWLDLQCDGEVPKRAGALQIYLQFMYSDYPSQSLDRAKPLYYWPDAVAVKVFKCEDDDLSDPECH